MNEQVILKSKLSFGITIFIFWGGIVMLVIATYLGLSAFQEKYTQLPPLILGIFFGLLGIFCIVAVFTIPMFEIYKDRLEVKYIWGKTRKIIYKNEIISLTAKQNQGQIELTIFTNETNYKINSVTCRNFEDIKNELIKGKNKITESKTKK
jgi:hypothetical protein